MPPKINKKQFDEGYDRIYGDANKEAEKLDDTLGDVEDKHERIKLTTSETLKFSKQISQQETKRAKVADDLNKSYASLLGNLLKGNIAEIASFNQSKKTLGLSGKLRNLSQGALEDIKDINKFEKLSASGRKQILDLGVGISDGLYGQADAASVLENLSEKDLAILKEKDAQGNSMASTLTNLGIISDQESDNKAKTLAFQNKINARLGIAGAIFGALLAVAQKFAGSVDAIGKQFGSLNVLSQGFQKNLFDSQEAVVGLGATMEDVVSTANELSGEFGIGLDESANLSAQIIDTAKAVGLSNEEAAKLSGILQTTSGLSAEQAERLTEGAYQLAVANNVNPKAVMQDLANSAEEFALFSKDGGDNLARATVQARAMGLSLSDTAKMAGGMLDFQSSITKEIEASVLIGRQLNLQKAREAALSNDLVGFNQAIAEQLGGQAEFNELNSIQRKALADALETDVANLAKMVTNQEKANDLAGETAKSFSDIIGKEAMSELTATMNELKIFGVAIANTLGPLLMGLAKLVNVLLVPLGNMVAGLSGAIRADFGSATTMNDGVIGKGGISMMAGPAGVFRLNPRDSVMATTNPIPVNDVRSGPAGSMGGKQTIVMNARVKGKDLVFLNDRPNAGGDAGYEGLI